MWNKATYLMCLILVLGLLGASAAFGSLVIERRIEVGSDDVEQNAGSGQMDVGSSDLELLNDGGLQIVGLRFTDLDIPSDAVILEAWLQFEVDELEDALAVNLVIEGELSPDPVTFSEDLNNVSNRPRTEGQALWSVPEWPEVGAQGPDQASTDISSLIEELIAQDGWEAGNAMVFIISDDPENPSQGIRTTASYSLPSGAPMLHIRIFGETATDPIPADGTENVTPDILVWSLGDTAASHDVYFGTNPAPGPDEYQGRQSDSEFALGELAPGTTYYWRIDEVEADDTTIHTGAVWSFTTIALAPHSPIPADGARWIDADVDLNWEAGRDTLLYDLYFGTDADAVANGTGDTFKGQLFTTTFDPGPLAEDTTYYWRLDGYEADGITQHAGPAWRFTTAGQGGGLRAEYYQYSVNAPPTPAEKAFDESELIATRIDPQINTNFESDPIDGLGSDRFAIKWKGELDVAFSEPYTFVTRTDDGLKLWVDGQLVVTNWTNHGTTFDSSKPIDLVAGQRYTIEMWYFENNGGAVAELYWESPSTPRQLIPPGALSLPLRARRPLPNNKAENVMQTPILSWTGGEHAAQHDVYFGDDADAVAQADTSTAGIYQGRQEENERVYHPGPLEWNTTYYWRVDEVNDLNPDGPWPGSVWSFTIADFLVVDDFELYTDDETDRIFETWVDGWGYLLPEPGNPGNGTGSTVGYIKPPFTERTIINSGYQSMPLEYINAEPPYYSEATRTWDTPQDWTVNGIDTLTVHVRGSSAHGQEPLYVVIEDSAGGSAVIVNPNPDAIRNPLWIGWSIPLSDFSDAGVNLAAVKQMGIGIGDRDNSTEGGNGILYVDDINITRSTPVE